MQDKSNLLKAIRHEVLLRKNIKRSDPDEVHTDDTITKLSQLASDIKKAIVECFLHPNINKQKRTSREDKALNRIVEEYEAKDWDSVPSELNTKQSSYQCFVRYNTNN